MSKRFQVNPLNVLGQDQTAPVAVPWSGKRTRTKVNPFDLLGQSELFPIAVYLPGKPVPNFTIAWKSFHQSFLSEIPAFFRWTRVPKIDPADDIFRDCRIKRNVPLRAVFAAALWHVVFFVVPWPNLPVAAKHNNAFDNTELTWSGPIDDLPLLNVPKQSHKPAAKPKSVRADAPPQNDEAFHPRQRIYTDPVRPTHPRQTLVNTDAPMEAPKVLRPLPNMVQLAATAGPARPHLEISAQTLAKLRPKEVKRKAMTDTPPPDAPNMETHVSDFSIATTPEGPARPHLEINAGSVPRIAEHQQNGDSDAAPELATNAPGPNGGAAATVIALSASPAAPAPVVEVPRGNLAANVAISPEGKGNGASSGSGTAPPGSGTGDPNGVGKNSVGISISGGNPKPNAGISGLGGTKLMLPRPSAGYKRPDPNVSVEDTLERTGPPNFAALPPGAPPEKIFESHRVYAMNVSMPNLNSVTGSWIIHFAELHQAGVANLPGEVSAPAPVRKVDPKYPQDMIKEHVEGEVILYGVIRPDGSVDSIQVVRKLDPQLDANSVAAFKQWRFEPGTKNGQPVALEAIVHIPFRGPQRD
jgi:TonB family protein